MPLKNISSSEGAISGFEEHGTYSLISTFSPYRAETLSSPKPHFFSEEERVFEYRAAGDQAEG